MPILIKRPRRNRKLASIRALVAENSLSPADLIAPFFIIEGSSVAEDIPCMPLVQKLSLDRLLIQAEHLHARGIPAIALFPVIHSHLKDALGTEALNEDGLIPRAIREIKREIPSLCVISDLALDPYTSHGHDGLLGPAGDVLNDETVDILTQIAILHAQCGSDLVAPSDMMDGRILAIRKRLDQARFEHVGILSYTAKYASSLYAPFRETLQSKLISGDKKSYQMNPANSREALLEAMIDEEEGADILMVKPALHYLDVIAKLRARTELPICAFHVSGEYAMVMASQEKGFLDARSVFLEGLLSIKRSGASCIISYAIPLVLDLI